MGGDEAGARGGQEQRPDVGEGAEVEVVEGLREQRADDVLGPQAAEGQDLALLGLRHGGLGVLGLLVEAQLRVSGARVVDVVEGPAQDKGLCASRGVQARVVRALLALGCLLEAEEDKEEGDEQEDGVHDGRQGEGVLLDHGRVERGFGAEPAGECHGRVGQPAADDGAEDSGDVEAHGQDEERPRLVLPLDCDLRDHGADDADQAVYRAREDAPRHGGGEALRESISEAPDGRPQGSDQEHHLAASPPLRRVGCLAPGDGGQDLGAGEAARKETSLGWYLSVGEDCFYKRSQYEASLNGFSVLLDIPAPPVWIVRCSAMCFSW